MSVSANMLIYRLLCLSDDKVMYVKKHYSAIYGA